MKTKWIAITLLLGLLMGCRTVGPSYTRPIMKSPDAFRGSADATPPTDAGSLADLKWFEVFKDEQLQKLISEALESNYDLRDAVTRVDAARANLGITRADQLPNIGVSSNITTSRTSASGAFPLPQGFEQRRTFGSLALSLLSFEADIWGRLRSATKAARADLLATEENRKTVVTTLVSDVAGAYFNLLELDMELEIAERTLTTREESLKLIRNREQSGLATLLEVRQGEQLVHAAEQVIPEYRATHRTDGEPDQPAAWPKSRADNAGATVDGAGAAAVRSFRIAVGVARAAPGHPRRRAKAHLGECDDRRRQGGLLSANQPDGFAGISEQPVVESLLGLNGSLAVRASSRATDLYGWTYPLDCRTEPGAGTARTDPVRAR